MTPQTLLGYDSIEPGLIPADAAVIFPYADGPHAWTAEDLARFPRARRRSITIEGDPACNIADIENGDMRPADAPRFLEGWREEHPLAGPGTIYCNRDTLIEVQAVLGAAKISEWNLWLATLDGSRPRTVTGGGRLVAVQYDDHIGYDLSVIWDRSWPRRPR